MSVPLTQPAQPTGSGETGERITALFEAHNRALLRFLTCRLRSTQEAREVAQEAYVRLLQLDSPSGIGYLRAFLFKTAANLAADRLKSASRRGRIDRLEFFGDSEAAPSPEDGIAAQQELTRLLGAISDLPPKCRYAFIMHSIQGHSLQEVADSMNLSQRMVRLYVERALAHCRNQLAGEPT